MPVPPVVRSSRRIRLTCLALALLATAVAPASASAAPGNPSPRHPCATLRDSPAWYGTNRARIQQVVDMYAPCGAAPTRSRRTALGGTTPVAVFDSYQEKGWDVFGGTSAATPIITGIYADAGTPPSGSNPASFPYSHTTALNDITTGNNGTCSPAYLCSAEPGYDGPTGLGTPNGTTAFHN